MKRKIEFASHPANLSLIRTFVRQFLTEGDLDGLESDLIVLGVDEACSNIIRYAYNQEVTHPITLSCERTEDTVRFRLRDFGVHADPQKMHGRPLHVIQPGGLGLHLIRKAFDQVDYLLKKRGTELVLTKRVLAPAKAALARKGRAA